MSNKFYKVGFFVLLGLIVIGLFYLLLAQNKAQYRPGCNEETNVKITDSVIAKYTPQEEQHKKRIVDSVQKLKDSIDIIVSYMNDSVNLKTLTADQRNIYATTYNNLARIKLLMDFELDNARIKQLSAESDNLVAIITQYDKKIENLNRLSEKLSILTKYLKTTVDVIAIAASNGIIVAPS